MENYTLPWVLDGLDLGPNILEIGPGPGISTDILRTRVASLTCIEIDRRLAGALERRTKGTNVTVVREDGTAMPFENDLFDAAFCLTMLHHVPSAALQDCLLREVLRVLRPGGIFAGVDSLYSRTFGLLHIFDTMTIVDPKAFPNRLLSAGFIEVEIDMNRNAFRFRARRPALGQECSRELPVPDLN